MCREKLEKPPLGIAPEFIYEENRIEDLLNTVLRFFHQGYLKKDKILLLTWIDEIKRRIENYRGYCERHED